jgi:hypothetical protein
MLVPTNQIVATHPIKTEYLPRLKGPCSKVFLDTVTLKKIGIAYEV